MKDIYEKIEKLNIGKIEKDISASTITTYKAGGNIKYLIHPKNIDSLIELLQILKNNNIKYKVIGYGSNLLFSDKEYDGVIIKLDEFNNFEFLGDKKIKVGAGYPLIKLSLMAAKKSLTGLEFASGIPGSVGGAIYMNAGAYKSDMGYVVESVKVLTKDYKVINLENKELDFHYRSSFLQRNKDYVCLEAIIKLNIGKKKLIEDVIRERKERRILSQPLEYPSAGSVFRNPENDFAGRLIESVGLKGYKKNGAMISEKHANFVVNYDKAKSQDIKYLIDTAHDKVLDKFNIDLKIEQEFVNWE